MYWLCLLCFIAGQIQTASAVICVDTVVCVGAEADLLFILDSSCSVNSVNFEVFKSFMQNVSIALDVGEDSVRIGTIRYSNVADIMFNLNDTFDNEDLLTRIDDIAYECSSTNTDIAIETMRLTGFTEANGDREGVLNIGVVLTDGMSENPDKTADQSALAQAEDIYMVSVGVTGADDSELSAIASDPDDEFKFYVDDFSDLASIEEAVAARCCAVAMGRPILCVTQACLDISGGLVTDSNNGNILETPATRLLLALTICVSALCVIF